MESDDIAAESKTFTKNNDVSKIKSKKVVGLNGYGGTPITDEVENLLQPIIVPNKNVLENKSLQHALFSNECYSSI